MEPDKNPMYSDEELRRILQEPVSPGADWTTPSDRLWEGVAAARPRRRVALWWWLPVILVVGLLAAYLLVPRPAATDGSTLSEQVVAPLSPVVSEQEEPTFSNLEAEQQVSAASLKTAPTPANAGSAQMPPIPASDKLPAAKTTIASPQKDIAAPASNADASAMPELTESIDDDAIPVAATHLGAASAIETLTPLASIQPSMVVISPTLPGIMVAEVVPAQVTTGGWNLHAGLHADVLNPQVRYKGDVPPRLQEADRSGSLHRVGLKLEWHHNNGWYVGTGLDWQRYRETIAMETTWEFTRKNSQDIGPGRSLQQAPMILYTSMGVINSDIPLQIQHNNNVADYLEGETVHLKVRVRSRVDQVRIPVYMGYRYDFGGRWYTSLDVGCGLVWQADFRAEINRVQEVRNRIRMHEQVRNQRPDHMRSYYWDTQSAFSLGYSTPTGWDFGVQYAWFTALSPLTEKDVHSAWLSGHGAGIRVLMRF